MKLKATLFLVLSAALISSCASGGGSCEPRDREVLEVSLERTYTRFR